MLGLSATLGEAVLVYNKQIFRGSIQSIYLKEFQGDPQKKSFIQFLEYVEEEGSKLQLHNNLINNTHSLA